MQIGVIGVNHKVADLSLREQMAMAFATQLLNQVDISFVLLTTCNRVELYFSTPHLTEAHQYLLSILRNQIPFDFEQKLYTFFGADCFLHLANVVSGLDSAIVGETEIKHQVHVAYKTAHTKQRLHKELHYLFQKSFKIAKKIRTDILCYAPITGFEHIIYDTAYGYFDKKLPQVLFIGASQINLKVANFLAKKIDPTTLFFATRNPAKELFIKEKIGASCIPWQRLSEATVTHNWIIAATGSNDYLVSTVTDEKTLLIDLAVPRNIDPALGRNAHVQLMNIDHLCQLQKRQKHTADRLLFEAEKLIGIEVLKHIALFHKTNTVDFVIL